MASKRDERDRAGGAPAAPGTTPCLFCRVVSCDLPAHVVYEDALAVAFLDHRPLFPGHALVVPRAPTRDLMSIPDEDLAAVAVAAKRLAASARSALGADGAAAALAAPALAVVNPHTTADRRAQWGDDTSAGFLRLSCGIEDTADLLADLTAALDES